MNRRGFLAMLGGLMVLPFARLLPRPCDHRMGMDWRHCRLGCGVTKYRLIVDDKIWLPVNKDLYCYTAGNLDALGGLR